MRRLKVIEHVSLDGVMQHSPDDNGFPHRDWVVPYRTADGRDAVAAAHGDTFDLVLGRRTYELWSQFWPAAPSSPIGDRLNAATKYVVTHHLDGLEWAPSHPIGTDVSDEVRRIKSVDGPDLVVCGSSTLVPTLIGDGLVDDLLLIVYPVLLGAGKRLFADGTPPRSWELVSSSTTSSGVLLVTYRPKGALTTSQS